MRILFILDNLKKLKPHFDSSLFLLKECYRRGHSTWSADVLDIFANQKSVFASTKAISPDKFPKSDNHLENGHTYSLKKPCIQNLEDFDLILIRKEPPFDMNYVFMTYLLDQVTSHVFVTNHPTGIRNTNEKLGCLHFSKWMPQTIVTSQLDLIQDFQKKLGTDIVVKYLDQKGGIGVEKFSLKSPNLARTIQKMTEGGNRFIAAQEFIETGERARDKRITLLNGKVLWSFEKRAKKHEFRTNLDQGAEAFRTPLTHQDEKLLNEIRPYLKAQGLHLVGLDIMGGKLIDFNVTCPGGFTDAIPLYPKQKLIAIWADFLEDQVSKFQARLKP